MVPLATPARLATSSSRAASKPRAGEFVERGGEDRLAPGGAALLAGAGARLGRGVMLQLAARRRRGGLRGDIGVGWAALGIT